jgi:hypothetical protein
VWHPLDVGIAPARSGNVNMLMVMEVLDDVNVEVVVGIRCGQPCRPLCFPYCRLSHTTENDRIVKTTNRYNRLRGTLSLPFTAPI